jgi:hypothetical protein
LYYKEGTSQNNLKETDVGVITYNSVIWNLTLKEMHFIVTKI